MNSSDNKLAKTNGLCLSVKNEKRSDYLEWDEYFMAMTFLELRRGAPGHNNNAAIILNQRKIIISMANSCLDTNKHELHTSHAEYKALQKIQEGNVMYTTSFPCDKCAEAIAQAGIKEIVFYQNNTDDNIAKELCDKYGITYRQFNTKKKRIELDFSQFCDD
ncbi:putative deoxycytidylate deaminase-like Protein [Tribolium castaneum]|uniref:dCMP deaminase n=1 Tax=Tribolium castaneum TaxID=7070 RepID=A0A139WJS8_TRICA|nr:PREDICTED: deoxycytidylate deaminase-like [Tribolium castaneum]KYB28173.1 putative deoxycytidylate deaminase-like Protein [Tribolium castaneum]|eukprot:XP_008192839.1 PREDICTED: deoxycytidylate deaminase-like [Tribolium castaneum]